MQQYTTDVASVKIACQVTVWCKCLAGTCIDRKQHWCATDHRRTCQTCIGNGWCCHCVGPCVCMPGCHRFADPPHCALAQVLGAKRKTLAGFSTATTQPHQGFIYNSDVIQQTPPGLRGKASRMVGAKCTLLARMDAYGQDPSGQAGEAMKVLTCPPVPLCFCPSAAVPVLQLHAVQALLESQPACQLEHQLEGKPEPLNSESHPTVSTQSVN